MGYKILLINWRDIEHPEAGGAEVHAHEIFRRLAAAGHEVTFLTCAWPGCESEAEIDGIKIIRGGKNMTFNYAVPGLLKQLDADSNFDIVVEDVNKIPFRTPKYTRLPRLIQLCHPVKDRTAERNREHFRREQRAKFSECIRVGKERAHDHALGKRGVG